MAALTQQRARAKNQLHALASTDATPNYDPEPEAESEAEENEFAATTVMPALSDDPSLAEDETDTLVEDDAIEEGPVEAWELDEGDIPVGSVDDELLEDLDPNALSLDAGDDLLDDAELGDAALGDDELDGDFGAETDEDEMGLREEALGASEMGAQADPDEVARWNSPGLVEDLSDELIGDGVPDDASLEDSIAPLAAAGATQVMSAIDDDATPPEVVAPVAATQVMSAIDDPEDSLAGQALDLSGAAVPATQVMSALPDDLLGPDDNDPGADDALDADVTQLAAGSSASMGRRQHWRVG